MNKSGDARRDAQGTAVGSDAEKGKKWEQECISL